jgi:hypothetical protein
LSRHKSAPNDSNPAQFGPRFQSRLYELPFSDSRVESPLGQRIPPLKKERDMESQRIRPFVNVTVTILLLSMAVLAQDKPTAEKSAEDKPSETNVVEFECDTGGAMSMDGLT